MNTNPKALRHALHQTELRIMRLTRDLEAMGVDDPAAPTAELELVRLEEQAIDIAQQLDVVYAIVRCNFEGAQA